MSSFIRLTTGGRGQEKKLNLGGVKDKIRMLTAEWKELEDCKDNLLRAFARKATGAASAFESNEEAIEAIRNSTPIDAFRLSSPIDHCAETLFHAWRKLIEKNIVAALKLAGLDPPDLSHAVETSSPLIFFLMSDRDPDLADYRKVFKDIEYDYKGYCPYQPMERLLLLLDFPVSKLFTQLPPVDLKNVYVRIFSMSDPKLTRLQSVDWKDGTLKNHISHLIDFYNKELPIIESIEEYYTQTALNMDAISYIIEHDI